MAQAAGMFLTHTLNSLILSLRINVISFPQWLLIAYLLLEELSAKDACGH